MKSKATMLKGFILFLILWYLGSILVQNPALPSPIKVFMVLPSVVNKTLLMHVGASAMRLIKGIGIATVLGFIIGLAMGKNEKVNQWLNPLIYFTYPIPKTALLPILMILFGLGDGSKVTLIVIITVFQVIVTVRDAAVAIPSALYAPLVSLGATAWQKFHHVTFRWILPDLLTAIRLSIGTSLSILFFTENYGTTKGLGYYIQDMWNRMQYDAMFAGIFLLALLGFVLFIGLDRIEKSVLKWRE